MTTTDNQQSKSPTRNKPRIGSFLLLFLGIGILAVSLWTVKSWVDNQPTSPSRPPSTELPFVETLPVVLETHTVQVRGGGFVTAKTTASITPQVSGKIVALSPNLDSGKRVAAGEVLVQLEQSDYQVALDSAKANLVTAQSNYQQAQGQSRQAARDVKRLGLKATDLSLKKPQLDSAKAAVSQAQTQVEQAQTNLNRTTISAPFSALVQSSEVAVGEIAGNTTVLATLMGTDTYIATLTLDSNAIKLVALGDKVTLYDSVYGQTFHARLSRFAAGIDEKNRTIAVYVDIKQPLSGTSPLLLQSYLTAIIAGKQVANSLQIPNSAIVNNAYVWGKLPDDSLVKMSVDIISRDSEQTLVTLPTATASEIIVRPKEGFVEGQKVTSNSASNPAKPRRDKARLDAKQSRQPPDQADKATPATSSK